MLVECMERLSAGNFSITVIGDLVLDAYSICRKEYSFHEKVDLLKEQERNLIPGNAANVANNIAALGGTAILHGTVGMDNDGCVLLKGLRDGVDTKHILRTSPHTSVKNRIMEGDATLYRHDTGSRQYIDDRSVNHYLCNIETSLKITDGVIISDLGEGTLSEETFAEIVSMARKAGRPVFVDPARRSGLKYRKSTVLIPNLEEFNILCDSEYHSIEEVTTAARSYLTQHDIDCIIVKGAEAGSCLIDRHEARFLPALCSNVKCSIGAGDSYIASMAAAIASGTSMTDAFIIGNICASISVMKPFTSVVTLDELTRLYTSILPGLHH